MRGRYATSTMHLQMQRLQAGWHVTEEGARVALADHAEREHGHTTVWVNNAKIIRPSMLHKMDVEDF